VKKGEIIFINVPQSLGEEMKALVQDEEGFLVDLACGIGFFGRNALG